MENTLEELETDANRVIERRINEKCKLEQFLAELKSCAEQYVPVEEKNFHNKWNRVKVCLNTIFCSFDEFECIWAEALQNRALVQAKEVDQDKVGKEPHVLSSTHAASTQTDPCDENSSENQLDDSVIDWQTIVAQTNRIDCSALKSEKDPIDAEDILENTNSEKTRKISMESLTSNSGSNSPIPQMSPESSPLEEGEELENQNNSNNNTPTEIEEAQEAPESNQLTAIQPRRSNRSRRSRPSQSFSNRPAKASPKNNQPYKVKGNTTLQKYRRSGKSKTIETETDLPPHPPIKKIKNLMETIERIRQTPDNSYETTLKEICTLKDKLDEPMAEKTVPFETTVMENALKFYTDNF